MSHRRDYSVRFLESESRWVICAGKWGDDDAPKMTLSEAKTEMKKRNEKQQPATSAPAPYKSMDISSGLGIGGYGSDDHNIWTEHDTVSQPERYGCKWGGTRYDEACANCGRVTAICNDCELCEKCHG